MSSSDITVAALTASPTLRGNKLAWTYSDPRSNALPNIGLDMVEVHASTTNDRTTATKVGEGITDFTHSALIEDATWYYWIKARDYLGSFGSWYPTSSGAGISAKAVAISGLTFTLNNGKLVASVSANALTIAVKTVAGNDASATDPVSIAFQSGVPANGNYSILTLTAALSLTISSGSTLGAVSGVPFRLWVVLFNDAGTLRLGLQNSTGSSTSVPAPRIYPLFDAVTAKSFAEGGAGAADGAGNIYTTIAVASALCRIVGTLEWSSGLVTAGTWSSIPDIIKLYSAESNKPGSIVQEDIDEFGSVITTTTLVPLDNTIPQSTEGAEFDSRTFGAQSACNILEVEVLLNVSHSVASGVIAALFKDSGASATASGWTQIPAADALGQVIVKHRFIAGDTSFHDYKVRAGPVVAGTLTVNGTAGAQKLNGTLLSSIKVRELVG
jgi:hypothetical protein